MSRKNIGFVLIAAGVLVALLGLLADVIGVGDSEGSFGWQQTVLLVVGIVVAAGGAFLAVRSAGGAPGAAAEAGATT
jgi:hypothetical protein